MVKSKHPIVTAVASLSARNLCPTHDRIAKFIEDHGKPVSFATIDRDTRRLVETGFLNRYPRVGNIDGSCWYEISGIAQQEQDSQKTLGEF